MPFAIIDTNVYVDHWEGVLPDNSLADLRERFIVRQSSIVLSELRRGARTAQARRLVDGLRRLAKIQWTPIAVDWWEAADIIQRVGDAQSWDRRKRQEFQNDVLIALSARRHGATVITTNRSDFELLSKETRVEILFVNASPIGH